MRTRRAIAAVTTALGMATLTLMPGAGQEPARPGSPPSGFGIQWRQPLTHRPTVQLLPGPTTVIVSAPEGGVASFARSDGRLVWSSPVASRLPLAATGPLVGVVTLAEPVELVALTRIDGAVSWRTPLESAPSGLVAMPGRFIATFAREVRAWRVDGTENWRTSLDAAPTTAPAVRDDLLIVATVEPSLVAFDAATGKRLWRIPLPGEPSGLSTSRDRVYLSVGDALLAYRLTGQPDAAWRHRLVKAIGAPAVDEDSVYYSLIDNTVTALGLSGGNRRWSRVVPSRPAAGPLVVAGVVIAGLTTGIVVEISPDGKLVPAPAPPELAGHRLSVVAFASLPAQVFTVSAGSDGIPVLFAWGRPATEAPRLGDPPAASRPPR